MSPFFSVVIPLYNKEDFIENTIKSVLNQSFQNFEIIIVNDGSTDNSLNIVERYNDERIIVLSNKNGGLSFSRNYGAKKAKGKFIAFLDADDLWCEDFLQTIHNVINIYSEFCVFSSNIKPFVNGKKIRLQIKTFCPKQIQIISNYFTKSKNIIGPSSLVVKREVFDKIGYFDETINYGEENDFYIRCFNEYQLIYYKEPKVYYRIGVESQLTAPNSSFHRKIPDYEVYLKNNIDKDLKRFIDLVHYRLVVLFKMEKNYKLVSHYKNKINPSNLSFVKKIKYYLPTDLFYITKKIYIWFSKTFIHS
jgi:glycosyltransferase involved in cell wall biosynthesis